MQEFDLDSFVRRLRGAAVQPDAHQRVRIVAAQIGLDQTMSHQPRFFLVGASRSQQANGKIANLLAEEGISVARRTVAKYRESMNIASSSERCTS